MKHFHLLFPLLIVPIIGWQLFATEALAQWSTNPAINNAICTNYYNQNQLLIISDGSGGAIFCWNDKRNGLNGTYNDEVYAQRISSNGNILWTIDGIKVTPSNVWSDTYSMCSDGNGGAFISWHDILDSNSLYVQHINASGTLMWDSSGAIICSTTISQQIISKIASDGNGGAIIAWGDTRNGGQNNEDVYAQRVNAAGVVQWDANGMAVINASGFQGGSLQITSDGGGGAIMVWEDQRSGTTVEIYTQKVNAAGAILWDSTGVLVNSITGGSLYPQLINDAGGAIICWVDRRNGNNDWNIYAQKISSSGMAQWAINGVGVCLASSNQNSPQLTSDGNGGAIITWNELGSGIPDPNIYAQRVNASGTAQWATNGVGVCLAAGGQGFPQLTSDGNGGAVITWQDARTNNIQDIYAQRIDSSGSALWTNDGIAVSTATFVQAYPLIINGGGNGMIIGWTDYRSDLSGQRGDIYVQRVSASGTLGGATGVNENDHSLPTTFTLEQNYPNPFNPNTTISYQLPTQNHVTLKIFDVLGREVATLVKSVEQPGFKSVTFDASKLSSGMYFYRLQAGNYIDTKKLLLLR
jgi:hypothetical protein